MELLKSKLKVCRDCGQEKPQTEFYAMGIGTNWLYSYCKPCWSKQEKNRKLVRQYGINFDQYVELARQQEGVCYICKQPPNGGSGKRLVVDHSHSTGKNRELLCDRCNRVLGSVKDSPDLLISMARYLCEEGE